MTNRSGQSELFKKTLKDAYQSKPGNNSQGLTVHPKDLQCITSESQMSGTQITRKTEKALNNTFECLKPLF